MNGVPCEGFDYDFDDYTDNSSAGPDGRPSYGYIPYGKPPAFPIGEFTVRIGPQLLFATEHPIRLKESENSLAHHTDRYKLVENPDRMIVRRAAAFQIEVTGENELDEQCSLIHFTATHTFDGDPVEIDIPLFEGSVVPPDAWGCRVVHVEGRDPKKLLVDIHIPKDAAIGEYAFKAQFGPNGRPEVLDEVEFPKKVVILFNPWSEEDEAFCAASGDLDEYLLSEDNQSVPRYGGDREGNIGTVPWVWAFDQFREVVLDCTLNALAELTSEDRRSAISVTRHLTAWISSPVAGGPVLAYTIDRNALPGTSFEVWHRSSSIFDRFKTGGIVRWGQCWNFAAVLCSSVRTLGLAARPVLCSLADP